MQDQGLMAGLKWEDYLSEAVARKWVMDISKGGASYDLVRGIYEKSFAPGAISDADYQEFLRMYTGRGATEQIQAFERQKRSKALEDLTRGVQTEEGAFRGELSGIGRTLTGMGRVSDLWSAVSRKMPPGWGLGGVPGEGAPAQEFRRALFAELSRGAIAEKGGGLLSLMPFTAESVVGKAAARSLGIPTVAEMERRYQRGQPPLPLDFFPEGELGERRKAQVDSILRSLEDAEARQQSESSATVPSTVPNASGNSQKTEQRINAANVQMSGATLQNGRQTEPD
jgi:hypothetical protein